MAKIVTKRKAVQGLRTFFRRNGYIRWLDPSRREEEGRTYKKGNEIRLVAESRAELAEIRRLLKRVRFKLAKPFVKARQWRQPVYGVAEVARFLETIGWSPDEE